MKEGLTPGAHFMNGGIKKTVNYDGGWCQGHQVEAKLSSSVIALILFSIAWQRRAKYRTHLLSYHGETFTPKTVGMLLVCGPSVLVLPCAHDTYLFW